MKNYGPYVVVRRRRDGTVRFRFEVRRDRPDDWPPGRSWSTGETSVAWRI